MRLTVPGFMHRWCGVEQFVCERKPAGKLCIKPFYSCLCLVLVAHISLLLSSIMGLKT